MTNITKKAIVGLEALVRTLDAEIRVIRQKQLWTPTITGPEMVCLMKSLDEKQDERLRVLNQIKKYERLSPPRSGLIRLANGRLPL